MTTIGTCRASVTLIAGLILSTPSSADNMEMAVSGDRLQERMLALAQYGKNADGGVDRVAFSDADIGGRAYIKKLMREAGLEVRIDTAGNIIGRRAGKKDLPVIMIGSHTDSVPGGGNYDGPVGVIGAIEVAQVLHDSETQLNHPLEVIDFTDEEGGLTGSRAVVGKLSADALKETTHSGLSIREGIIAVGGDPDRLDEARYASERLKAFVELHIEQGATLHDAEIDIGVVEGIVGIQWWDIIIEGFANHAGTTPMNKRQDAMLAAAALTLAINRIINSVPGGQVGTVGRINAEPGAPNVIPGRVVMSLEIRDLSEEKITQLYRSISEEADAIATQYETRIRFDHIDVDAKPALTDPRIRSIIAHAADTLNLSHLPLPSGAGHDAQDMALITPTGMIFVPSVDGISHSPRELTTPQDIANGANVLLQTVLEIDRAKL